MIKLDQQIMKGRVTNFRVLKEPAFWETAWLQARDASLFRTKSLKEKVNSWNRRARSFKENTGGEKGGKRVENVFQNGWTGRAWSLTA